MAQTFYLLALWLPLAIAASVAFLVHGLAIHPASPILAKGAQVVLAGLQYAGIPYMLVAAWATWWIRRHSEREIRRVALRAPLLVLCAYVPFAFLLGTLSGRPLVIGGGLALLGSAFILAIGYAWVGIVLATRSLMRDRDLADA